MGEPSDAGTIEKAYALGYEYEGKYGACSQCTLLAIMDALDMRDSKVFQASFGFAGGIASLSKTCGALSAGIMAISMVYGRELSNLTTQTEEDKRKCLQMVRDLHSLYMQKYGDIQCSSVHQMLFGRTFDQWDKNEFQEFLRLGLEPGTCQLLRVPLGLRGVDQGPVHQPNSFEHLSTGVRRPLRMDSLMPGTVVR